jgi:hypothetical protein
MHRFSMDVRLAIGLILLFGSLCLGAADAVERSSLGVENTLPTAIDRFRRAQNLSDLKETIFWIYRQFGDPALTPLLIAVWNKDRKQFPDFPWMLLESPYFRVEFA